MQITPIEEEPVKYVVKQYKQCPVRKNRWTPNEAWRETMQTMSCYYEQGTNEVKQYKTCPVMMNRGRRKWNNKSYAQ